MTTFVEIKLTGIENPPFNKDNLIVYGVRTHDAANRLVGIAVSKSDAEDIIQHGRYVGSLPTIEVPDNGWFYVAALGPSLHDKGNMPS